MTVHIGATRSDVADTVLLPGDPLRAQWIAETFLDNPVRYNIVRNMFGFTGTYNGKPISVQGTGMGVPSLSIYVTELFQDFDVQTAIRVGTCGGMGKAKLRDIIIAMSASTDSGINRRMTGGLDYSPVADFGLLEQAVASARSRNLPFHVGGIATMDQFYDDSDVLAVLAKLGVLGVEMETSGLYTLAAKFNRRALSICTVSDIIGSDEATSAQERESTFSAMIEVALETASK